MNAEKSNRAYMLIKSTQAYKFYENAAKLKYLGTTHQQIETALREKLSRGQIRRLLSTIRSVRNLVPRRLPKVT